MNMFVNIFYFILMNLTIWMKIVMFENYERNPFTIKCNIFENIYIQLHMMFVILWTFMMYKTRLSFSMEKEELGGEDKGVLDGGNDVTN